jgi:hypothetical protein
MHVRVAGRPRDSFIHVIFVGQPPRRALNDFVHGLAYSVVTHPILAALVLDDMRHPVPESTRHSIHPNSWVLDQVIVGTEQLHHVLPVPSAYIRNGTDGYV